MLRFLALLAFASEFVNGGLGLTGERSVRNAAQSEKAGIPVSAEFVRACGWTMTGAAAALFVPFLRRPAALLLAGLLAPITYIGHRFWEVEDPDQRRNQRTQFFKNLTMLGGALFIASSK